MNNEAVDGAASRVFEVKVPGKVTSTIKMPPPVPAEAPEFVRTVTAEMMAMRGDSLPVSKMPIDGRFPLGTTKYEKAEHRCEHPYVGAPVVSAVRHVLAGLPARPRFAIKAYDPAEYAQWQCSGRRSRASTPRARTSRV